MGSIFMIVWTGASPAPVTGVLLSCCLCCCNHDLMELIREQEDTGEMACFCLS